MYLTQIKLNPEHPSVHYDTGNVHALHQRVMSGFLDLSQQQARAKENILFRTEPQRFQVLVQSRSQPDWGKLPKGYAIAHESKDCSDLLSSLAAGRSFRFRLKANPSRRDPASRKQVGINKPADQLAWLERQAERNGFTLVEAIVTPLPTLVGFKRRDPGGDSYQRITLRCAEFGGVLRVADQQKFCQALQKGIGRGQAYGCGLLAIAPV